MSSPSPSPSHSLNGSPPTTHPCRFRKSLASLRYRGVSKDDPSKVCAVMQAAPGVMEQFIADNTDMIAASGHVIESTVSQVFVAS